MQINAKTSTSAGAAAITSVKVDETKQIQENLNKWDDLCPLSEEQLLSIKKLQQYNQYQIDDDFFNNDNNNYENLELVNTNSNSDISDNLKKINNLDTNEIQNLDKVYLISLLMFFFLALNINK